MNFLKKLLVLLIGLVITELSFAQAVELSASDTNSFGSNPKAGKYLVIRGISMYYESYGVGEPLLMIHGNGGSISSFMNQIPYYSKTYQVIAVDSRAQGKSVDLQDSLSFEMMADDFDALLDDLHLDSCNVLGWSDGGINGLLLAIRHPDKVKRLAITGANLWPDSTAISAADYLWALNYYDTLGKMPQTPEIIYARKLVKLDLFEPHITRDQLQQIKCPVLVIGGDHDIILSEHTFYIYKSIPNAFLWILPNSSHATLIDYKERFNEVVGDFFGGRLKKE
jgi:pimeloyl-ACP methyl ester carboxylesterase